MFLVSVCSPKSDPPKRSRSDGSSEVESLAHRIDVSFIDVLEDIPGEKYVASLRIDRIVDEEKLREVAWQVEEKLNANVGYHRIHVLHYYLPGMDESSPHWWATTQSDIRQPAVLVKITSIETSADQLGEENRFEDRMKELEDLLTPAEASSLLEDWVEPASGEEAVRWLYVRLMKFKDDPAFQKYKWAIGGPFNRWLVIIQDQRKRDYPFDVGLALGDLLMLAEEYHDSNGAENEETRHFAESVLAILNE